MVMSTLDDAKYIALSYARKKNPNVRGMEVTSAEESLSGDKWVVYVSWLLDDGVLAKQHVKIVVTESGKVVGYTEELRGRGVG